MNYISTRLSETISGSCGTDFPWIYHCAAGYLTAIPGLLLIASAWTDSSVLRRIRQVYFGLIAFIMACIFIVDLGLYGFWGFRLDATPIFYFFSSPKDAMASVSFWFVLLGIVAMLIYAGILYCIFYYVLIREKNPMKIPYRRQNVSLALLLLTAALFIPIRGGFTVSTMNLSKVYFSSDQLMNHAAINPAFSFMYSATHQNNFEKQYRFMDPNTADKLFAEMVDKPATPADSIPQLLNTQRPNIVFIILESFSTHLMETFGGQPNVAVNMDKFAKEGILFSNFYANSFRTDRGLASIISGYPGQPSTSIMKYPEKDGQNFLRSRAAKTPDTTLNIITAEMRTLRICALTWYLPVSERLFATRISLCPNVPASGGHKTTYYSSVC